MISFGFTIISVALLLALLYAIFARWALSDYVISYVLLFFALVLIWPTYASDRSEDVLLVNRKHVTQVIKTDDKGHKYVSLQLQGVNLWSHIPADKVGLYEYCSKQFTYKVQTKIGMWNGSQTQELLYDYTEFTQDRVNDERIATAKQNRKKKELENRCKELNTIKVRLDSFEKQTNPVQIELQDKEIYDQFVFSLLKNSYNS